MRQKVSFRSDRDLILATGATARGACVMEPKKTTTRRFTFLLCSLYFKRAKYHEQEKTKK